MQDAGRGTPGITERVQGDGADPVATTTTTLQATSASLSAVHEELPSPAYTPAPSPVIAAAAPPPAAPQTSTASLNSRKTRTQRRRANLNQMKAARLPCCFLPGLAPYQAAVAASAVKILFNLGELGGAIFVTIHAGRLLEIRPPPENLDVDIAVQVSIVMTTVIALMTFGILIAGGAIAAALVLTPRKERTRRSTRLPIRWLSRGAYALGFAEWGVGIAALIICFGNGYWTSTGCNTDNPYRPSSLLPCPSGFEEDWRQVILGVSIPCLLSLFFTGFWSVVVSAYVRLLMMPAYYEDDPVVEEALEMGRQSQRRLPPGEVWRREEGAS